MIRKNIDVIFGMSAGALVGTFFLLALYIIFDIFQFIQCVQNKEYHTPWYDNSWIRSPAKNLFLRAGSDWSQIIFRWNVNKDEVKVIQEFYWNDKVFWTIIYQGPVPKDMYRDGKPSNSNQSI